TPGGRSAAPGASRRAVFRHRCNDPHRRSGARRAHRRGTGRNRPLGCGNRRTPRPGAGGMIDFYYWPTPNGWKVAIMLEETGLAYAMQPVDIGAGDQFKPDFMAISPNARMPAIVDHDDPDGPLPIFESGAILIHLAEKTGQPMP